MTKFQEALIITGIVVIAAVLRLWGIASVPAALQYDEAVNGLTAVRILSGEHPGLLTLKDGREPIHFYLVSASIAVLGRTPGALRLPFVTGSIGIVVVVWMLARELFGSKVGWLTALLCAVTVWPVYLGRYGTRSVFFALLAALALFLVVRAWRLQAMVLWIAAGLLFGVLHYTYPVNFFVLPACILIIVGASLHRNVVLRKNGLGIATMISVIILVALPMWIYRSASLTQSFARPQHLAVFYAGQGFMDFINTIAAQTVLVFRMFFLRGDTNPLHNIPGRPVFDAAMTLPLLLGVAVLAMLRYRRRGLLILTWTAVFLLPTFLSKGAPHFLRAVGILPVLFIFPALGLMYSHNWLRNVVNRVVANIVVGGLMAVSVFFTARDLLFRDFLHESYVYQAYNGPETSLGLQINRRMGAGWTGRNLMAKTIPEDGFGHIWVDPSVWDGNPYAQFLVPGQLDAIPGLHTLVEGADLSYDAGVIFVHPQNTGLWLERIPSVEKPSVEPGPWFYEAAGDVVYRLYDIVSW